MAAVRGISLPSLITRAGSTALFTIQPRAFELM
jgi:hypothetical protein